MTIKFTPKLLIGLATVGLAVISAFFIFKYLQVSRELADLKANPAQLTALLENQNQKTLNQLGQLMELPQETPRIITISDKNSIANEPLLSKAEVGDTFVVYATARKAILYRPSQNKIIDVIPVSAPTNTPPITPSSSPKS